MKVIEDIKQPVLLNRINHMDCIEGMKLIQDETIDMILCDLPYGALNCKWDNVIPFDKLWEQYLRIAKPNAAIVLTAQQPFATDLINSCRKYFRYEIIWQKTQKTNFANAKKMPLRGHENILVFYKKLPTYNPQKYYSASGVNRRTKKAKNGLEYSAYRENPNPNIYTRPAKKNYDPTIEYEGLSGGFDPNYEYNNTDGMMYPDSIIKFSNWNGALFGNTDNASIHPTQKPVDLFRYLIKTFSNPGDLVMDNCMGSGTTAIACVQENRNYIGFELDKDYYEAACKRIKQYKSQLKIF
jgi:site-specific DNA-methyltransferase (adenine-specific)